MIKKRVTHHRGVKYSTIELQKKVDGFLANGETKYVLKGKPAIEEITGSYKYGDQVQITVYGKKGTTLKTERINNSKYDRIEIFIPKEDWMEMMKEWMML